MQGECPGEGCGGGLVITGEVLQHAEFLEASASHGGCQFLHQGQPLVERCGRGLVVTAHAVHMAEPDQGQAFIKWIAKIAGQWRAIR